MATSESLSLTESIGGKRYYNIIDKAGSKHKFPSVTTVISAMTDQTGLINWRKRVGDTEADRISKYSANRGTVMHQMLEYFFLSEVKDINERFKSVNEQIQVFVKENNFTKEEFECGNMLFEKLYICGFFNRVDEIVEMEETLWSAEQGGFAGRVDCIYKNKAGELVLLDFKTAAHTKKKEWITNYYLQLSAYFLCYFQMYGIKLDKAELWISVEQDNPQLIEISQDELKVWLKHFLALVKAYHQKYDYLLKPTVKKETTKSIGNIKVRHFA